MHKRLRSAIKKDEKPAEKPALKKNRLEDVILEPLVTLKVGVSPQRMVARSVAISPTKLKRYDFGSVLGSGTSGTVYQAQKSEKRKGAKDVAIKVQMAGEDFGEELRQVKQWSKLGAGPTFIQAWVADGVGFIATDKWDMSLLDYIQGLPEPNKFKLSEGLAFKLETLIRRMHEQNVVHGDILEKNILVNVGPDGQVCDLVLTDFGLTDTVEGWQEDPFFLGTMRKYLVDENSTTRGYMQTISPDELMLNPRHLDYALLYHYSPESVRRLKLDERLK
jgi:serine/threonine protein kinase